PPVPSWVARLLPISSILPSPRRGNDPESLVSVLRKSSACYQGEELMGWTQPSVSNAASVGQGDLNDHHEEASEGGSEDGCYDVRNRLGKESISGSRRGLSTW